jgi:flagellar basal-body rod protein FlgB
MDILAKNLANADTPNYKARDVEFAAELDRAGGGAVRMTTTQPRHLRSGHATAGEAPKYRYPHQPAQDGNTVEADLELARFAENAVAYQASLLFLNGRIATLRAAITGGR